MAKSFKYKAFISYSHQDKKWGDWLHKNLETFRIPKGLVGKETKSGVVPKRLFPIFRDREELPTSHELGKVIGQALQDSSHLVVICSPRSAKSQWVNQEIKEFKRLGKSDNILCLIVDGEPNATDKPGMEEEECFPEAARYEIGENGELIDKRTEPIAADAREGKDGKRNALLKLIAGLINVGFDDLKQRDLARKQKRMAIFSGALMTLVAIMAGLTFWALDKQREAERQQKIAVKAKDVAEEARISAIEQKQKAEKSEEEAIKAQQEAEWESYINHIALADAKIKEGDISIAENILWDAWNKKREYCNWEWGRLMMTADLSLLTIRQNSQSGYVESAMFSPNGKEVLVARWYAPIKIESAKIGKVLKNFSGHRGKVYKAVYSSDGSKIISTGEDATIRIWDVKTQKELHRINLTIEKPRSITDISFTQDDQSFAASKIDGTIEIWEVGNWKLMTTGFQTVKEFYHLIFHPMENTRQFSQSGTVCLTDLTTGIIKAI